MGKYTVGILTKQGESKFIPDVYHVEGLKHNLLSIGQLIQKGYKVYIEDDHYVIKDKRPSLPADRKSANDKHPLVSIEDSSQHEREDKYRSYIQGKK